VSAGTWSAPGRVNLIGEHTDYNEGFVLPFELALRVDRLLRIRSSLDDTAVEIALDDLEDAVAAGTVDGWSAYPLGVAWALGRHGADLTRVPGADLVIDSSVPVGAGLSSSAAIESAVALALDEVWGLGLPRETLARVGQLAENAVVGAPTGIMDQSASLLGRADAAVFLDCRTLDTEVVPLGLAQHDLAVLVIDTGVHHSHATGGYGERRASCEAGAAALGVTALRDLRAADLDRARDRLDDTTFRRVRHVVTENARVLETVDLLRTTGPRAIGALLDASHASLRDDFEVSVPELDLAVETAQRGGALGARMTGGGFGGAAIALVPRGEADRVGAEVLDAFARAGFATPVLFPVTASDGARRDS
jgi:galactokinase